MGPGTEPVPAKAGIPGRRRRGKRGDDKLAHSVRPFWTPVCTGVTDTARRLRLSSYRRTPVSREAETTRLDPSIVIPGLDPGIHGPVGSRAASLSAWSRCQWVPGLNPGTTAEG